jgi:hypothetical protein
VSGRHCGCFTCFTGTKVRILTQKALLVAGALNLVGGNLLYWYKSTNTDAEGAASRWRAESGRGELLVRAALGVRQVFVTQFYLLYWYKSTHTDAEALSRRKFDSLHFELCYYQVLTLLALLVHWYTYTDT